MKPKQFILALSLILAVHWQAKAQDYIPMAVENAQWLFESNDEDFIPNSHYGYKIKGDTIINNISYKKVYSYACEPNTNPPFVNLGEHYAFALRDDIVNRRVYAYLKEDVYCTLIEGEYLVFDFNLNADETAYFSLCENNYMTVTNVYYQYCYGEQRKFIELKYENGALLPEGLYAEGIGAFHEIIDIACPEYYCAWLYNYCIGESCMDNIIITSVTNQDTANIDVFYSSENVLIVRSDNSLNDVSVYDTSGKKIANFLTISQTTEYSFQHLPAGIYFVRLSSDNQFLKSQKIVKL